MKQTGSVYLPIVITVVVLLVAAASFWAGQNFTYRDGNATPPQLLPVASSSSEVVASSSALPVDESNTMVPASSPLTKKPPTEVVVSGETKTYINNNRKFSFQFSKTLQLNTSLQDEVITQFLEYQPGTGNTARMVQVIYPNPQNSSLEEVIKREKLLGENPLGPKYEYFKIQGREAVNLTKVMTQTELCNDGDGTQKKRIFNFLVKGEGFVVEIHPNESCDSFKRDWFEIVPSSFKFI